MRTYTIDTLEAKHTEALREELQKMQLQGSIEGIFWLPIPQNMHNPLQKTHQNSCGPYAMAFEIEEHCTRLELLVRARNALHCECVGYASPELQQYMIHYVDKIFDQLCIKI